MSAAPSPIATVIVGALLVACASCDDAPASQGQTTYPSSPRRLPLSREEQARLIFQVVAALPCKHAAMQAGDVHDHSPEGFAQGSALNDWREQTLISHPEIYTLEQTAREGSGWSGSGRGPKTTEETFTHAENGQRLSIEIRRTWGKSARAMGMRTDPQYMQVSMNFCEWIPSHVEIIDTIGPVSDTILTVSYRLVWKATAFSHLAWSAPSTQQYPQPEPIDPVSQITLMRSSRNDPWRVEMVHD